MASEVDVGESFTAVTSSVIVPAAGPAPWASRISVVMVTSVSQLAAGVKLTAARAALTAAMLPEMLHTPLTAS